MEIGAGGGYQVVRVEDRVLFLDRGTQGPAIVGLVAGGLCAMGLVWTGVVAAGSVPDVPPSAAWVPLAIAVVTGAIAGLAWRAFRRRSDAPAGSLTPLLIADLAAGSLLDADGRVLAPLDAVRVQVGLTATSSAPSLSLSWPGGRCEVLRGGLAGGGLAGPREALAALGVG